MRRFHWNANETTIHQSPNEVEYIIVRIYRQPLAGSWGWKPVPLFFGQSMHLINGDRYLEPISLLLRDSHPPF